MTTNTVVSMKISKENLENAIENFFFMLGMKEDIYSITIPKLPVDKEGNVTLKVELKS